VSPGGKSAELDPNPNKKINTAATVLIDTENKTALVTDSAVPLTHNLPKNEAEKITKYENFALEINNVWKLKQHVYIHLSHLSGSCGHQKLPKISREYRFN
jgi:hypothetical protein